MELDKIASENEEYEVDIQLAENAEVSDEITMAEMSYDAKRALLDQTKIVKQTWSILEIFQKIKDARLILDPDYQRNEIWREDKKTAFIESLFMGIIIPPIYVVEIPGENILEENTYEVVDGKQRLSTIRGFIKSEFVLQQKSLEYYTDWFAGKKFDTIRVEQPILTNAMLSSVLDIYVITANSPEFTKYDIFSRLNKGSEKLKVNEIRKAIYQSNTVKIISDYIKEKLDSQPYNLVFTKNDIKRYEDYGRFFRSIAFYERSENETASVKGYNSRPREMINNVLQDIQRKRIQIEKSKVLQIIEETIQLMLCLKEFKDSQYLLDACIYFAVEEKELFYKKLPQIMMDQEILETFEKSASTTSNVNQRWKRVCEIMKES
jgi:uncharacterized membrane protein